MDISRTTIGFVAVGCLAVGAAGTYLTTRTGGSQGASAQAVPVENIGPPVEQSEAVVDPAPAAVPERAPAPARSTATPAPTPRPAGNRPAPVATNHPPLATPSAPVAAAPIELPASPIPADAPRASTEVALAPPEPRYEDLELPTQAVIGLQLESSVSSETARVEDEVIARVTRDVRVGDKVAIPAGAKAHGEVTLVERGARLRDRARLGVRFTSIVLADGTRVPIETEAIYREGDSVRNENAAKIGGGAIGGAIIGGILGGAKGAAIGTAIGGGAGTAAVAAGGRNAATLPSGSPVTVRIERPVTVTVER